MLGLSEATQSVRPGPGPTRATGAPAAVIQYRPTVREMVRGTWEHRHLIFKIGTRVTVKGYANTKLGRPWIFIRPSFSIIVQTVLFGSVLNAPSKGTPYLIFLLAGMIPWIAFDRLAFWSVRSFDVYRRLAANLNFPLLLVPTSSLGAVCIELGVFSTLFTGATLGYLVATGHFYLNVAPNLVLAPLALLLSLTLAWGVGMWVAPLNVKARDVRLTFRYVLMMWVYVTPVVYPVTALPPNLRWLATANPVTAPIEMFKKGLINAGTVDLAPLLASLGWAVVLVASGLWFFTKMAPGLIGSTESMGLDEEDEFL